MSVGQDVAVHSTDFRTPTTGAATVARELATA
jgi:hypothetical protein